MSIELNRQLMMFVDVVRFNSFAEAARHRDMLPSLLSRNIKTLEAKLGLVLLNRTTRAISLTEAGEEIYRQALNIREMENQLNHYAQSYGNQARGQVRLTCASHLGPHYVLPVVNQIQATHPDIHFEVHYDDQRVDIIREDFDLAIRVWTPEDSTLVGQKLRDARLVIIASPTFLARHGKPETVEELCRLPAACYARKGIVRNKIRYYDDANQLRTVTFTASYRANAATTLIQSAKLGHHFTMVTDHNLTDELETGELIELFPDLKAPAEDSIYAIYPNRELSPAARLFLERIKARFADY